MGVSTHSEPKKLFIFSAYRHNRTDDENQANHAQMTEFFRLHALAYTPILGCYKGNLEEGFLISADVLPEEAVLFYSRHFHQDEYMVLDNHKHGTYIASMVNCATCEQKQVGFMRSMPEAFVLETGMDYTYRQDINTYWVVWHTANTQLDVIDKEKAAYLEQRKPVRPIKLTESEEPFGTPSFA